MKRMTLRLICITYLIAGTLPLHAMMMQPKPMLLVPQDIDMEMKQQIVEERKWRQLAKQREVRFVDDLIRRGVDLNENIQRRKTLELVYSFVGS